MNADKPVGIRMYIHPHVCEYTYISNSAHIYIHVYRDMCKKYLFLYIVIHIHLYIYSMYVYIHSYLYIGVYTHIYIYTDTSYTEDPPRLGHADVGEICEKRD